MPSHPEIPPNSRYFTKEHGAWRFCVPNPEKCQIQRILWRRVDDPGEWRDLIAKLAAQEWQDEAKALTLCEKRAELEAQGLCLSQREAHYDAYADSCNSKAAQWRAWAKGEWKAPDAD